MPYDANKPDEEDLQSQPGGLWGGATRGAGPSNDPFQGQPRSQWSGLTRGAEPASGGGEAAQPAQPGRFVNFNRYMSANRGVANTQAGRVAGQVEGAAKAAGQAINDVQGAFETQVNANRNMGGGTLATNGDSAQTAGGQRWANAQKAQVQENAGLQSNAVSREEAGRRAAATYTPVDVTQTAGYDAMSGKVTAAQSQANALGSQSGLQGLLGGDTQGGGALNAALIGQAGGKRFSDLYAQYGKGQLDKQREALAGYSAGVNTSAGDAAQREASRWGGLVADYDQAQAERDKAAEAAGAPQGGPKKYGTLDDYDKAAGLPTWESTPGDMAKAAEIGGSVGGLWGMAGSALSKGVQNGLVAGGQALFGKSAAQDANNILRYADPTQWGTEQADKQVDFGSLGDRDTQAAVYNSMSQEELDSVAKMSPDEQRAWLAERKKQLGL